MIEYILTGALGGVALTLLGIGLEAYLEYMQQEKETRLNSITKINTEQDHLTKLKEDE